MSTALLTRPKGSTVTALDVFCGFGGSSQGIHKAGADVIGAANHNPHAIDVHARNFPDTEHFRADLVDEDAADYVDPKDLPYARFAWFSPSCKDHSQANAKKVYARGPAALFDDEDDFDEVAYANSERSRVSMMCVLRYMAYRMPDVVVVENVVEVTQWGPGKDGSTFKWWYEEAQRLGYEVKPLFLNSMFFPPCPQSRDRIYIVMWRKGHKAPDLDYRPPALCTSDTCSGRMVEARQTFKKRTKAWRLPQWGRYLRQYIYTCPDCKEQVHPVAWPALSAIDLTNLGPTMAERREIGPYPKQNGELKHTTEDRVRRGLMKFRGGPAVLLPAKGGWGGPATPVTDPMATQTSQQERAMATGDGMVLPIRTSGGVPREAHSVVDQIGTIVSGNVGHAFVVKNNGDMSESKYRSHPITDSLGAVTEYPTSSLVLVDLGNAGSDPRYHGNRARHGTQATPTVMTSGTLGLASEGVIVPVGGNDHERPGQTRARSDADPIFTLTATQGWGYASAPFIIEMRGGGSKQAGQHPITGPLHTVSAQGMHHGLSTPPMFSKINGGPEDTTWHDAQLDPFNTVTAADTHGYVAPTGRLIIPWVDQWRSDPAAITEQLATVMTHLRHALASIEVTDEPITEADWDQVRFRMLEPDYELRRAMAFGDHYHLDPGGLKPSTKRQMTAGLGNAVVPPVAEWITMRCMATFGLDLAA